MDTVLPSDESESDNFPRCSCGKYVRIYSTALGQGFCSEEHYAVARGEVKPTTMIYKGHGIYETKEE